MPCLISLKEKKKVEWEQKMMGWKTANVEIKLLLSANMQFIKDV